MTFLYLNTWQDASLSADMEVAVFVDGMTDLVGTLFEMHSNEASFTNAYPSHLVLVKLSNTRLHPVTAILKYDIRKSFPLYLCVQQAVCIRLAHNFKLKFGFGLRWASFEE